MRQATANRTPLTLRAYTASDLMMPNPISIRSEAGVAEAIALFADKGITAAPVIDEAGHPIGVVSRSDLLIHEREVEKVKREKSEYFDAPRFASESATEEKIADMHTVADLMTPAIFAVSPDTPVHRVVSDMVGLHVHRLFVVDEDGVLVGVISTMDVLKQLKPEE